eukprot:6254209-Prymnesium_polylepis.1
MERQARRTPSGSRSRRMAPTAKTRSTQSISQIPHRATPTRRRTTATRTRRLRRKTAGRACRSAGGRS